MILKESLADVDKIYLILSNSSSNDYFFRFDLWIMQSKIKFRIDFRDRLIDV